MQGITFNQGLVFALLASLFSAISFSAFSAFSAFIDQAYAMLALEIIFAIVSFSYIGYLMQCSRIKTGRPTVSLVWLVFTLFLFYMQTDIMLFVGVQIVFIWLVRCLFYYSGLVSSMIDFCLTLMSVLVAIWVALYTDSLFLYVWSFFLCQACFAFIAPNFKKNNIHKYQPESFGQSFDRSFHQAERAVRQILNNQ